MEIAKREKKIEKTGEVKDRGMKIKTCEVCGGFILNATDQCFLMLRFDQSAEGFGPRYETLPFMLCETCAKSAALVRFKYTPLDD